MEKLFAVLGGPYQNIVKNIIVAESKEIAEACTNAICIEYTHEDNVAMDSTKWNGSAFVLADPDDLIAPTESIK